MKMVKPLIDRPFIPQEVDRLSDTKRKIFDDSEMSNAILVGPKQKKGGLDEKPSMYSTVIERHATSVVHPIPQPVNYSVNQNAANNFAGTSELNEEITKMSPGAYSIPVKLEGGASSDPTLAGYETPNFIHTKEKVKKHNQIDEIVQPTFGEAVQGDIQTFVSQIDNATTKDEKIKILKDGKCRLKKEAKLLSRKVQQDLRELLFAKEVAAKLSNVISRHETKVRKAQLSELKLADEVTIKNKLRQKMRKELQGFRTSPSEFKELEKIDPIDISNIINQIKMKLGN